MLRVLVFSPVTPKGSARGNQVKKCKNTSKVHSLLCPFQWCVKIFTCHLYMESFQFSMCCSQGD